MNSCNPPPTIDIQALDCISPWESTLLRLLNVPSVTGNEAGVATLLESELRRTFPGAEVFRQDVGDGRWNVLMSRGDPQITLTTHIDTVPGGPAPSVSPTHIHGRGACDAKGQVVAQLWGLQEAISAGLTDYRCAYVVGEETDARGARALVELPPTRYLLNGEPTENRFVRHGWGVLEIEISATGVSAHSSLGTKDSAIHALIQDLEALIRNEPEGIQLNIGTITGGLAPNVQAPSASCVICARFRGDPADVEGFVNAHLTRSSWRPRFPGTGGVELFVPALHTGSDVEVKFASDCSVYASRYDSIMLFGPGRIQDAHTDTESIERVSLREAARTIKSLLIELSRSGRLEPRPVR